MLITSAAHCNAMMITTTRIEVCDHQKRQHNYVNVKSLPSHHPIGWCWSPFP